MNIFKIASALSLTLIIAACGGGGGSPPASNTVSGYTAKGPISNATVWVFKAADYSTPPDTTKALNANAPATTNAIGYYSVNVGSYSGPIVVVAQSTATSTMLNEVTGVTGPVPAGFEMRAVAASLAVNSTIHVTPYTEMAANAAITSGTWTTNAAANINTANAVVRTSILLGLDPLTTSPVVVSSAPTSEQAASQQMAVALAAVVQASTGTIGTTDCSLIAAAEQTQCAVNALSGTVATIDSANNAATINTSNVVAISNAMGMLTTVHVPTTGGTSTPLDTTTDPGAMTLKTSVANTSATLTANADSVTGQAPANPPSTTVLNGVTQAKAFVSDLRTNVHLFSNNSKTGLLDQQTARFKTDMAGNIAPNVSNVGQVVSVMGEGIDLLVNAALPDTFNCMRNPNSTVTCWADTTNNPFFGYYPGMVQTAIELTLTSTSANAVSYTATAQQCTVDINYACTLAADTSKATGSGTISRTVDALGNATSAAISGTLPGSNSGIVRDSIALNASGLNTSGNTGRIDLSGSVKGYGGTPSAVDATPSASLLLDTGTYFSWQKVTHVNQQVFGCTPGTFMCSWTVMPCTINCTYQEPTAIHVSLTASVRNTKFNGTLDIGSFIFDKSKVFWSPTTTTFNGTITDTAAGGNGAFLTGRVTLASTGYASYDATQPTSATNFDTGTTSFNGNITFPNARPVNLVWNIGHTGYQTGTVSANFTYGNGKSILVNSVPFDMSLGNTTSSVTLTNQDGLKITFDNTPTVKVLAGSDVVATITGNTIYYSDGYMESLN